MRCAVAFLPCHIRQLMNLLASFEPYTGSGLSVVSLAVRFPMVRSLFVGQFKDGVVQSRPAPRGATRWTTPSGSKTRSLMPRHVGHGTATAARGALPNSPTPAHFTSTWTAPAHVAQANSRVRLTSRIPSPHIGSQ